MEEQKEQEYSAGYWIKLLLGPALLLIMLRFFDLVPGKPAVTAMAGVTLWMAWWWLSEVVHLAVTSLLPMILLPLLSIVPSKEVAQQYMDNIMFLFIGGFIIAFAIERWNLHKRIALRILLAVGSKPSRILLGVMLTTFLLSMWISNTATVMMLLSAVYAVIYQVEEHIEDKDQRRRFAAALLIGLAYSASIGGMATLVGTPTNMIFLRFYEQEFPGTGGMNFLQWAKIGFPVALLLLVAAYLLIRLFILPRKLKTGLDKNFFLESYRGLGKMKYEERMVAIIFTITAVLWFTRSAIDFGGFRMPGWSDLFPVKYKEYAQDSTVAVLMAMFLFLIPARSEKNRSLITWKEASRLPFEIILLFGGGFALAYGFDKSGLSGWLAGQLQFIQNVNIIVLIAALCVLVTVISEFASNVASIQLILPILLAIHKEIGVDPLVLMIPATLAASLGFMLPVATAPNTIVFGSKRIKVREMMGVGWTVDLAGIIIITAAMAVYQACV
ncbi:MAG: solute carrier family 13 (sodium-dependent dicarboxylate transporter), member 2/3/5 [Bacteroidetes bacterium]|nr:MAG: solute carrier family 13 (sodium-dependent dicarboxylate transporter), member 2/3/5 [Bacteroidota bacterium]